MAQVCDICGKGPQFGNKISHAHNVSRRRWNVNLRPVRAHVNGAVQAGVVAARLNWPSLSPDGKSINALTSETLTDIGAGATFYSCLVEIEALDAAVKS